MEGGDSAGRGRGSGEDSDSADPDGGPGNVGCAPASAPQGGALPADAGPDSPHGSSQPDAAAYDAVSGDKSRSYSSDEWEQDSGSGSQHGAPSAELWVTECDASAPRTAREAVLARRAASRPERTADVATAGADPSDKDRAPAVDEWGASQEGDIQGLGAVAAAGRRRYPAGVDRASPVSEDGSEGDIQPDPSCAAPVEPAVRNGGEAQRQRLLQLVWERVVPEGQTTLHRDTVLRVVQEDPVAGRCMAQRGEAAAAAEKSTAGGTDGLGGREVEVGAGLEGEGKEGPTGTNGAGVPVSLPAPSPRPPTRAEVLHRLFLGTGPAMGYPEFAALFLAATVPGPLGGGAPRDRALRTRLATGDLRAQALHAAEDAWEDAPASALLSGGHGASFADTATRVAAVCNAFFAAGDLGRVLEDVAAGGGEAPWQRARGSSDAVRRARRAVQNAAAGMLLDRLARAAVTGALDLSALSLSAVPSAALGPSLKAHSLLLADNQLAALPEGLHTLHGLHTLRAPRNRLRDLPLSLCACATLRILDVSQNALVALPDAVGGLRSLVHLNVSDNAMTTLPTALAHLSALQVLDVRDNPLDADLAAHAEQGIASLFSYLRALRQLRDAGGNQDPMDARLALNELRDACVEGVVSDLLRERWSAAATSRSLLLARLSLREIPPDRFSPVEGLTALDVGGNPLSEVPGSLLAAHPALTSLRAPRCRLSDLPHAVSRLQALQVLDVSGNALEAVPPAVARLPSLRVLDMSDNAIAALPRGLGRRPRPLHVLAVHGNPVVAATALAVARAAAGPGSDAHRGVSDIVALIATRGVAAALRVIAAGACEERGRVAGPAGRNASAGRGSEGWTPPPEDSGWDEMGGEEGGDGDYPGPPANGGSPPPWLGLPRLDPTQAELPGGSGTPAGLVGVEEEAVTRAATALRLGSAAVTLAGLGVERVPPALFQCSQLTELSLARNRLQAVPPSLGSLRALRRLILSGNGLRADAVPSALGQLRCLHVLDLSDNRLAEVPRPVCALPALHVLDLSENRITALPPRLGYLQSLKVLGLHGNPLSREVFDAMHRGLSTLLLTLRARATEGETVA